MHAKSRFCLIVLLLSLGSASAESQEANPPASATGKAPETKAGAEKEAIEKRRRQSNREKLEALQDDFEPYAYNFYPYRPMYFGFGVDPSDSKYQVSFRYQFIKSDGDLAEKYPGLTGFNLAYTQTSFWDLDAPSEPFDDTSYTPEIFYRSPFILFGPRWARGFQVQTGYRHESNGRGGADSRSTDTVYGQFYWIFDLGKDYAVLLSPQAFVYVDNDNDTNRNLDAYRGNFEFEVMIAQKDGPAIATQYMHGTRGWSVRTDFTYPLHRLISENFELYFLVQRFDGYAESLIDFRKKTHATRIGFSLIR